MGGPVTLHYEWDDAKTMPDVDPKIDVPEKLLVRWMEILDKEEYYEQSGVIVAAQIKGFLANPKGFDPNTV